MSSQEMIIKDYLYWRQLYFDLLAKEKIKEKKFNAVMKKILHTSADKLVESLDEFQRTSPFARSWALIQLGQASTKMEVRV